MRKGLEVLLEIQKKDRKIRRNKSQIKRLKSKKEKLKTEIAEKEKEVKKIEDNLQEMKSESRKLNGEVDDIDFQIRGYKKQLEEGIISFKEMEALRKKISQLQERLEGLEDKALDMMLQVEKKEAKAKEQKSSLSNTRDKINEEIAVTNQEIQDRESRIEEIKSKRSNLEKEASSHLLKRYEQLRGNFDNPIVELEGRSCGGCKLSLSATTVEKVREDMEIVACENCSRILYSESS